MKKYPHIVCLGGGNAMPKAVLEGLKNYPVRLSVISAMLDSGGSAGREREYFKTKVSFGDFRRVALALSEVSLEKKERFASRYKEGPLANHVLANLYCTSFAVGARDNLEKAVAELEQDLKEDLKISPQHQLLPATLEDATLCVELDNGKIIKGEGNIDVPKHDGNIGIKRIFLEPEVKAYPKALAAIQKADLIVIGPGDLFSSLAQILLVEGISEAIKESKARKVYICNLMTKNGETNNFSVLNFTGEIEKLLGGSLDYVLYNNFSPAEEIVKRYKKEHPVVLELVRIDEGLPKEKFLGADLLKKESIEHDPLKISEILWLLLKS
jgi:uncharacterized cofD-like protein